ncbi:MAG: hypothetical protein NVSMB44_17260 [Ktedonobacteraceae bacterium]
MSIPQGQPFIETIFACIDDGVITIDASNTITFCNAIAGRLLNLDPARSVGQHYQDVFSSRPQLGLIGRLNALRMQDHMGSVVRTSIEGDVPGRGQVKLYLSMGLVTDTRLDYLGMVMILDGSKDRFSLQEYSPSRPHSMG